MPSPTPDPAPGPDHPPTSTQANDGQHAFSSYLQGIHQDNSRPVVAFPRATFAIALIGNLIVAATGFAPWITFTRRSGEEDFLTGLATDGMFAILASVVAVISLIVASRRGEGGGDFESLVALVASVATVILVGINFMYVDSYPIDNIFTNTLAPGWGLITAQVISIVATAASYRFWRAISVY